jgi:hypothetical protein
MLHRKRPAASAPGVFGIPRASRRLRRSKVWRARESSIPLRFITGDCLPQAQNWQTPAVAAETNWRSFNETHKEDEKHPNQQHWP